MLDRRRAVLTVEALQKSNDWFAPERSIDVKEADATDDRAKHFDISSDAGDAADNHHSIDPWPQEEIAVDEISKGS